MARALHRQVSYLSSFASTPGLAFRCPADPDVDHAFARWDGPISVTEYGSIGEHGSSRSRVPQLFRMRRMLVVVGGGEGWEGTMDTDIHHASPWRDRVPRMRSATGSGREASGLVVVQNGPVRMPRWRKRANPRGARKCRRRG